MIFSFLTIFLLTSATQAEFRCESPGALKERIVLCFDNRNASLSANACLDGVEQAWDRAPAKLKKLLSPKTGGMVRSGQSQEFGLNGSDLTATTADLERLLAYTKESRETVKAYLQVILDFPGAADTGFSSPCHSENKQRINRALSRMAEIVDEGEEALAVTTGLKIVSGSRNSGLGADAASLGKRKISGSAPVRKETSAPQDFGTTPKSKSDISGTRRKGQSEILQDFKLDDQL